MVWIIGIIMLALLLAALGYFSRTDVVPWLKDMRRVRSRESEHGEWLPSEVVQNQVIEHYQDYLRYAQQTLVRGWVYYSRDLDQYLTDEHLALQRDSLDERLRKGGVRLIDILRANHEVRVRNFSADGLSCLLLDYQTERRMATYSYWKKSRIHTQHLEDTICVYKMRYDNIDKRWKIAEAIQQLPTVYYMSALRGPIDKLDVAMPDLLGRDQ